MAQEEHPGLAEQWELSKENVVPVRTGRKKAALAELSELTTSGTKHVLEEKRRELKQDIQEYKGDDPLVPWLRLVKWTQEHLAGGKAELQKVLEACTSRLVKISRYHNDIRFLRIWIQYADCLPDPNDIFLFLKEKNIGMDFALFYEAYATYYELRGNCAAADVVYQDGINRGAKPFERLKHKYSAFQTRMAARIQRKIQDESAGIVVDEPARSSLATLVPAANRPMGTHANLVAQITQRPAATQAAASLLGVSRGPAAGGSFLLGNQQQQQQQRPGALLSAAFSGRPGAVSANMPTPAVPVAVDDEFQAGHSRLLPGYATMPQGINNLKELKPYGVIRKENNENPAVWAGSTLAQAAPGPTAPVAPLKLDICVDDEFQEDEVPLVAPTMPQPSFRQAAEGLHAASAAQAPAPSGPAGFFPAQTQQALGGSKLLGGLFNAPATAGSAGGSALQRPGLFPTSLPQAAASVGVAGQASSLLGGGLSVAAKGASSLLSGSRSTLQTQAAAPALGLTPFASSAAQSGAHLLSGHYQPSAFDIGGSRKNQPAATLPYFAPLGYDTKMLSGRDGSEMCFEEVRAANWLKATPLPAHVPTAAAPQRTLQQPLCTDAQPARAAAVQPSQPQQQRVALGQRAPLGAVSTHPASLTAPMAAAPIAAPAAAPAVAPPHAPAPPPARRPLGMLSTAPAAAPAPLAMQHEEAASAPPARKALGVIAAPDPASLPAALAAHTGTTSLAGAIMEDDDFFSGPDLHVARAPAPEPTVTVSTRAAFAAMNDFFGGGPTSMSHRGSGASDAGSAHVLVQPPAAAAAQQHQGNTAPKRSLHHDPTVTINTKQAFAALNDMFAEQPLPHEESRVQRQVVQAQDDMAKMPSLPAAMKPISSLDVCRLANSSKGGAWASGNTQSLAIHEDTEYLGGGGAGSKKSRRSSVGLPGLFPTHGAAHGGANASFGIHEDTHLLGTAAAMAAATAGGGTVQAGFAMARSSSLNIYEDTVCVGLGTAGLAAGHSHVPAAPPPSGSMLYEDTEFIQPPPVRHAPAAPVPGVRRMAFGQIGGAGGQDKEN